MLKSVLSCVAQAAIRLKQPFEELFGDGGEKSAVLQNIDVLRQLELLLELLSRFILFDFERVVTTTEQLVHYNPNGPNVHALGDFSAVA